MHSNNAKNKKNYQNLAVLLNISLQGIHHTKVPVKCCPLRIEFCSKKVSRMI